LTICNKAPIEKGKLRVTLGRKATYPKAKEVIRRVEGLPDGKQEKPQKNLFEVFYFPFKNLILFLKGRCLLENSPYGFPVYETIGAVFSCSP